jgi:hypothetical protein
MKWWLVIGALVLAGVGVHYGTDSNARFCLTHHCIGNFGSGNGSIVQCLDGSWSHSGGIQGACSYHGGVASSGSSSSSSSNSSGSSSDSSPPTPPPAAPPPPPPQPTAAQRAATQRAQARRIAAERAAAARRAQAERLAARRRAEATLYAITNELVAVDDRVNKASGRGTNADYSELDRIQQKLTNWSVDHALDGPIGTTTPLQSLEDAAFGLDTTLQLVIQDGNGLFNAEWSDAIRKFNAALDAAPSG